jgi:hypothetical protein
MSEFDTNVFVNCPLDDDYRQLLITAIYTVKYLGYTPRLSIERADSAETRIDKIVGLINESKFGIHDLSRMVSSDTNEPYRMNMPFELGIDYGCKKFKSDRWSNKQILILEKEQYRYQIALSDLAGCDIKSHDDDPIKLIKAVRDWFVNVKYQQADGAPKIWGEFNDFQAYLYDEVVVKDGHENVDDVQISEVIQHMSTWLSERHNKTNN